MLRDLVQSFSQNHYYYCKNQNLISIDVVYEFKNVRVNFHLIKVFFPFLCLVLSHFQQNYIPLVFNFTKTQIIIT